MIRMAVRFERDDDWINPRIVRFNAVTQARTEAEALEMAVDLIAIHLEEAIEAGAPLDTLVDKELPEGADWVTLPPRMEAAIRIRELRKGAGLAVRAAAEKVGVSAGTYQRWENPHTCNATLDTLSRVAQAFNKRVEISFV